MMPLYCFAVQRTLLLRRCLLVQEVLARGGGWGRSFEC
jgi:hypothetical protein